MLVKDLLAQALIDMDQAEEVLDRVISLVNRETSYQLINPKYRLEGKLGRIRSLLEQYNLLNKEIKDN